MLQSWLTMQILEWNIFGLNSLRRREGSLPYNNHTHEGSNLTVFSWRGPRHPRWGSQHFIHFMAVPRIAAPFVRGPASLRTMHAGAYFLAGVSFLVCLSCLSHVYILCSNRSMSDLRTSVDVSELRILHSISLCTSNVTLELILTFLSVRSSSYAWSNASVVPLSSLLLFSQMQ